ncbi:MAG: NADH:ubiquinone oxidoreductase subunit NDUFA12 [Alphaproteobacteria bacterium]|nr:NADH:ubiquinone oxidoreductase subunit NDUFA12 [Alphaproteobacteria bacterium SS10]
MKLLSLAGVLSTASMLLMTWRGGQKVGEDEFGNRYYRSKTNGAHGMERRWVMYKGEPEASSVPPGWHAWLHRQVQDPPEESIKPFAKNWQQPHRPNPTLSDEAYRPPGHVLSGGKRDKATGDYEAWTPE